MSEKLKETESSEPGNISRRDMLKGIAITAGIVAAGTMVGANPIGAAHAANNCPGTTPKAEVQYQPHPKGKEQCSGCANFIAPKCCKVVAGPVAPDGYCIAFTPMPA